MASRSLPGGFLRLVAWTQRWKSCWKACGRSSAAVAMLVVSAGVGTAGAGELASRAVTVTLAAPTHSPRVSVRWPYVVRAFSSGKPSAARITAQIVDPIGGVHPVEFDKSTRKVVNWPFKGVFSDFVIWPAESRALPLTFRVTVRVGTLKRVLNYRVTPSA